LGTIIPSLPVGLTEEEGSICSVAAGFFVLMLLATENGKEMGNSILKVCFFSFY
jgi:hypothetical protein